jgi:hypothetical protein
MLTQNQTFTDQPPLTPMSERERVVAAIRHLAKIGKI